MATAHSEVDVLLLMQIPGSEPLQISTVRVATRTDLVPSLTEDGEAIALVTLAPTWQADIGEALMHLGAHLKGEGRPHLHS